MNWTQIAPADFDRIITLVELKDTLKAQIAKIDAELADFSAGGPATPPPGKPGRKAGRQAKSKRPARGALKTAIIELLAGAGKPGATVKEIAARLKVKPGNVHVWFSSTGKTIREIRKLAPAKYAWVG
jgi:hypothetical protein